MPPDSSAVVLYSWDSALYISSFTLFRAIVFSDDGDPAL